MLKVPLLATIVYCTMISLTVYIDDAGSSATGNTGRVRRFLTFPNNSLFFVRLNFKANMVPWNQIFAQAMGFRLNFEEPPPNYHFPHRLHRRDLYSKLQVLFDRIGLEGFQCIRRAICEVKSLPHSSAMYHSLLKIIFRRSPGTDKWHRLSPLECDASIAACPFSLLQVLQYTDI